MHLIILKWFRKKKIKTEEKNNETARCRSEKINWLPNSFDSFKFVIDHENFSFFLLSKLFTLFFGIPSVLLAASFQIVLQLAQVYGHTLFLFQYHMNL